VSVVCGMTALCAADSFSNRIRIGTFESNIEALQVPTSLRHVNQSLYIVLSSSHQTNSDGLIQIAMRVKLQSNHDSIWMHAIWLRFHMNSSALTAIRPKI